MTARSDPAGCYAFSFFSIKSSLKIILSERVQILSSGFYGKKIIPIQLFLKIVSNLVSGVQTCKSLPQMCLGGVSVQGIEIVNT